jgi:hypothetical protein
MGGHLSALCHGTPGEHPREGCATFTIRRFRPSRGMGASDLFGSQQYAPLIDVEIP